MGRDSSKTDEDRDLRKGPSRPREGNLKGKKKRERAKEDLSVDSVKQGNRKCATWKTVRT